MNRFDGQQTFSYRVHGLCLTSNFRLPKLNPLSEERSPETPDVVVQSRESQETAAEKTRIDVQDELVRVSSQFGTVDIKAHSVALRPVPHVSHQALFTCYAVYILSFLLHRRGFLTLHASAVVIGDVSVAFIGEKGMGKSTTAASFYAQGDSLLSDDMIACKPREEGVPEVDQGFPWMKLGPVALCDVLDRSGDALDPPAPGSKKRVVPTAGNTPNTSFPLRRIYVLGYYKDSHGKRDVQIRTFGSKQACMFLIANSFVQMLMGRELSDPQHLAQCATLSQRVPMSLLLRPRSMDALPSVYGAVRRDLEDHTD